MFSLKRERRLILFVSLALALFGALMVYESSSLYAHRVNADAAYFFKRQFVFLIAGLISLFAFLFVDMDWLRRYNKELLLGTFFLLILVILVSKRVGGARRWIQFFGVNLQPSEFLKVTFLLYCADYVQRKGPLLQDFKRGLLPLGIILTCMFGLLVIQPDLGTALFWVMWTLLFLFLHNAKRKHLGIIVIIGVICAVLLVVFFPYRFRRVVAYINPFADPQGSGFQLIQSQIAYGEGGLFGLGLGESRQKLFFLPAAHTDFIFSIIAEEFGFIGAMLLLGLYFYLFHRMAYVARNVSDPFRSSILWGIIFIFFLEVVINVGVSCGLFPTKGLSLPFMSYGGSNLVAHFMLLGLFLNASRVEKNNYEVE